MVFRIIISSLLGLPLFVASGQSQGQSPKVPKDQFHLYLLVGQSNMAGRGKVEAQDKKAASSSAYAD